MSRLRIDRYLLHETLIPMSLGLVVFTLVLFMGQLLKLVELVINKGVPISDMLLLFVSLLPTFLVLTLPLSFLLGVMVGLGRMSADREILALKACGTSLHEIARPLVILGLVVSIATGALTLAIRPASEDYFHRQLFHIASSRSNIGIEPQIFNDEFEGVVLYANEIDEQTGVMRGVFISDERQDSLPAIIIADSGRILSNQDTLTLTLHLENGTVQRQGDKAGSAFHVIGFTRYDLNLDLGQTSLASDQPRKNNKSMTMSELYRAMQADTERTSAGNRKLLAEFHRRLALPFAPLLFALIGVPLGIQPVRSGRGGGFAIGLLVFLGYYTLMSLANTLMVDAGMPGPVMYVPDLIFLVAGLTALRAASLEKPMPLVTTCRRATHYLVRRLGIRR